MNYQKNSSAAASCCNTIMYPSYQGWEESIIIGAGDEEDELMMTAGLRKGPWTEEEDSRLTSAIAYHGVGRWNSLANLAGLKRSGKSCRLRWLNYLRPDLRRGSFTLNEQLLILELHLRWGNRWSKIAENIPGRTDNEIKNYWRTKVQKLAKQFGCHVNSPEFSDALRRIWIPRLVDQIQAKANQTSNPSKAQNQGPYYHYGVGLSSSFSNSSSSTSSENCFLFDTRTPDSWPQTDMDHHFVGPMDMGLKPSNITDACEAHISPESGSSGELDRTLDCERNLDELLWDLTLYDADDLLFLQHQLNN